MLASTGQPSFFPNVCPEDSVLHGEAKKEGEEAQKEGEEAKKEGDEPKKEGEDKKEPEKSA